MNLSVWQGSCGHGNEHSNSIKDRGFLDQFNDHQSIKRDYRQ